MFVQSQVKNLNAQLELLNKEFEVANGEAIELKTNADLMEKRLDAASRLIEGLGSEHSRWSSELEELAIAQVKLLGDCLVSSSFLRYANFTCKYKKN